MGGRDLLGVVKREGRGDLLRKEVFPAQASFARTAFIAIVRGRRCGEPGRASFRISQIRSQIPRQWGLLRSSQRHSGKLSLPAKRSNLRGQNLQPHL
jgi:hypothetical protein